MRRDELCCTYALLVRGVQAAIPDVVHDRTGEQMRVLQHHAERAAQLGLLDLGDVDAVVADLALIDVVEAIDEVGDGGLAGTRGANKGDLLSW